MLSFRDIFSTVCLLAALLALPWLRLPTSLSLRTGAYGAGPVALPGLPAPAAPWGVLEEGCRHGKDLR